MHKYELDAKFDFRDYSTVVEAFEYKLRIMSAMNYELRLHLLEDMNLVGTQHKFVVRGEPCIRFWVQANNKLNQFIADIKSGRAGILEMRYYHIHVEQIGDEVEYSINFLVLPKQEIADV